MSTQDIFYSRANIVPLPWLVRAHGIRMWDEEGNEYMDVSSGPVVSNLGHGNVAVAEAMARQARELDFAYSRVSRHRPNLDLASRLCELAGDGYERACFASGGSEAMEIALKFARQYMLAKGQSQRTRVISLEPSYHGGTIATLAITGDPDLDPFLESFAVRGERVPAPLQYRVPAGHTPKTWRLACAEALEEKIKSLGPESVLAFVMEPVGGVATGALEMHEDYAERVREICTRYGVLLIYDEILCGVGRTGRFLASHAWPRAHADLVVLAKGLGAGYAPLGAMLAPALMVDELAELTGFNYSHTYNANPISCAVGLAVLDEYERLGLMERVVPTGQRLRDGLMRLAQDRWCIGDVRGEGLLLAVEMVRDRASRTPFPAEFLPTEQVRICGLENGLIIYSRRTARGRYGDWFLVAPPLTISMDECDELLERLDRTLLEFERKWECFTPIMHTG